MAGQNPLSSYLTFALLARCPKLTALDLAGTETLAEPAIKAILRATPRLRALALPPGSSVRSAALPPWRSGKTLRL